MIAPDAPSYDELVAQNAALRSENAGLRADLAGCRKQGERMAERLKMLTAQRTWQRKVKAAKNISPINKEIGIMLTEHYDAGYTPEPEADGTPGLKKVLLGDAGGALGVSADTVSRGIHALVAAGAFRYDVKREEGKDGATVNRSYYAPLPAWRNTPDKVIEGAPERKHGGKRIICPNKECESDRVIYRRLYICQDCGEQWGPPDEPANTDSMKDPRGRNIPPATQDAAYARVRAREDEAPEEADEAPEPTPIRRRLDTVSALRPAWCEGEDWYDPARPDDAWSQLLQWGLYEDVGQATVWYRAERFRGPFQRNASMMTVTGRGQLKPVDFVMYLRELYETGNYKVLGQIAQMRGGDPDAIKPLLQELGEPEEGHDDED